MSADLPRREPAPIADFAGLIAVVTGGGSGIGRELVLELARLGADVALCDLRSDGLAETVAAANSFARHSHSSNTSSSFTFMKSLKKNPEHRLGVQLTCLKPLTSEIVQSRPS